MCGSHVCWVLVVCGLLGVCGGLVVVWWFGCGVWLGCGCGLVGCVVGGVVFGVGGLLCVGVGVWGRCVGWVCEIEVLWVLGWFVGFVWCGWWVGWVGV
jgi:hypothetical protein